MDFSQFSNKKGPRQNEQAEPQTTQAAPKSKEPAQGQNPSVSTPTQPTPSTTATHDAARLGRPLAKGISAGQTGGIGAEGTGEPSGSESAGGSESGSPVKPRAIHRPIALAGKTAPRVQTPQDGQPAPAKTVRRITVGRPQGGGNVAVVAAATGAKAVAMNAAGAVAKVSSPPTSKPAALNVEPSSPLGKLMQRAATQTTASGADPAYNEISHEGAEIMQEGAVFRVEELLEDWPTSADDTEFDTAERQDARVSMVKRAVGRLNDIFTNQLDLLKVCDAGHPVCTELSQITKLTFLRVSDSPAAWDALAPPDYSLIVRALRVMAEKRKAATSGAKSKRKASAELEAAAQFEEGALDSVGDFGLDFGA